MGVERLFRAAVSSLYIRLLSRARPKGYLSTLKAAVQGRASHEWSSPREVWCRQQERVNALLEHARRSVPYYRRLAEAGAMPPQVDSPDDIKCIPILTKEIIRREAETLLAEGFPRGQMRPDATGGSTGEPMRFWTDASASLLANAGESWAMNVAGLDLGSRVAFLWGAPRFTRSLWADLKDKLVQLAMNRVFLNCLRMRTEDLCSMHRRLAGFRPEGIVGYRSALVELALFLDGEGLKVGYPTKAIISAAETLDDTSRATLERVFRVPVYNRYGSREISLIAMECNRHRGLHIDCENVFVELVEDPGLRGMRRIIVTKLNQFSMPFLRYDTGDLATGVVSACPCGRGYPLLEKVIGRVTEVIRLPGGGGVPGMLFPHLFKDCGIAAYCVIQQADYSVDVRLVRTAGQTQEQGEKLTGVIREHLGEGVQVNIRYVDRIERSRSGKLLPVISRVPVKNCGPGEAT